MANMFLLLAIFTPICVGLGTGLYLSIRRVLVSNGDLPVTVDWIGDLSSERYRPMLRLLDGRDLELLRAQTGFRPEMERELRRQHCQVFRAYLRSLTADFQRVCAAVKLLMLHSGNDRPDLASVLIQNQMLFAIRLLEAEFTVCLYRCGLCRVKVTGLVQLFDTTWIELRTLLPSASSAV